MQQPKVFLTPEDQFRLALDKLDAAAKLLERNASRSQVGIIPDSELQTIMDVSRRALYDYRREGILPYSIIKGRIYYEPRMIEDMLRRHRVIIKPGHKRRTGRRS